MKCANYMNIEAIRETVKQHWEKWGPRDEPMSYDLTELNCVRQCSICDFGGTGSPMLNQVVRVLDDRMVGIQDTIKKLTGEPLKRVCFKELKESVTASRAMMKQGTVSVLFGCHSPIHSLMVVIAWVKLYHRPPKPWEMVCIGLHDIGHWGAQYLDNYEEKKMHWALGARIAKRLFGQKGYDLISGHCSYNGQARSALYKPDKYSWLIAPGWWMLTNTFFEPKLIRPGKTRMQSVRDFKKAMRENWNSGLVKQGHDIYLEQWQGRK